MPHITFTALRKLVAAAKAESSEKNAVVKVLRADGYRTMPSVSSHRQGTRIVRVYLWRNTPLGNLALMAGPSIQGAIYKVAPVTGDVHAEDVNIYIPARGRTPAYVAWKPGKGRSNAPGSSDSPGRPNSASRRWGRFAATSPYYYGRENRNNPPSKMQSLIAEHLASISGILEEADEEGLDVQTSRVCPNGVVAVFDAKQAQELAHGGPFRAPHHTVSAKGMADETKLAQGGVLYLDHIEMFSPPQIASLGAALQKHPNVVVAYSGDGSWHKGYTPDRPAAVNERLRMLGVSAPYEEAAPEPAGMTGQQLVDLIRSVADTGDEAEADQAIDDAPNPVILDATMIEGLGSAAFGNEAQMRASLKEAVGMYYNEGHEGLSGYGHDEPEAPSDAPPSDEDVAAELEKLLGEPEPARSRQEKMEERLRERMEKKATEEAEAKAALQPAESASEDDEVLALLGLKNNRRNRRNPRARRNPELGDATISMLTTHLTGKGHSAEDAAGVAAMVAKAVAGVEGKSATEVALLVVQNLDPLVTLYFKRKGEEAPEVVYDPGPAVIEPDEPTITAADLVEALQPSMNKNHTIEEYAQQLPGGVGELAEYQDKTRLGKVYVQKTLSLTDEVYDALAGNLMAERDNWWTDMGGTGSLWKDPQGRDDFFSLSEAEQDKWRSEAYDLVVEVTAPGRRTFYVDPQGHTYARYVYFPAGSTYSDYAEAPITTPIEPSISDAEARAAIETLIRAKIKDVVAAGGAVMPSQDAPEDREAKLKRRLAERMGKKAKRVKDEPAQSSPPGDDREAKLKRRLAERLAAKKTKNPRRNHYVR